MDALKTTDMQNLTGYRVMKFLISMFTNGTALQSKRAEDAGGEFTGPLPAPHSSEPGSAEKQYSRN